MPNAGERQASGKLPQARQGRQGKGDRAMAAGQGEQGKGGRARQTGQGRQGKGQGKYVYMYICRVESQESTVNS